MWQQSNQKKKEIIPKTVKLQRNEVGDYYEVSEMMD